jgi:hypothetical protein
LVKRFLGRSYESAFSLYHCSQKWPDYEGAFPFDFAKKIYLSISKTNENASFSSFSVWRKDREIEKEKGQEEFQTILKPSDKKESTLRIRTPFFANSEYYDRENNNVLYPNFQNQSPTSIPDSVKKVFCIPFPPSLASPIRVVRLNDFPSS